MISNAAIKRREEKLISDWADGWEQREQAARLLRLEKRRDMVRHHAAARRAIVRAAAEIGKAMP